MADSLGLQGELAAEIAEALRATLSPEEKVRVGTKPTENSEAYVFYLRATQIAHNPDTLLEDYKTAEQLYRQAITLDPKFRARACAARVDLRGNFPLLRAARKLEIKSARRSRDWHCDLQPNLAEAHFALGQCIYWIDGDYERALAEFETAQRSVAQQRRNRPLDCRDQTPAGPLAGIARSLRASCSRLDPQNPNIVRNLIFTNTALRRWPEAAQCRRANSRNGARFTRRQNSKRLRRFLVERRHALVEIAARTQVPAGTDPDGAVTSCRWDVAMMERDYASAQKVLQASSLNELSYMNSGTTPKAFFEGCIALAQGETSLARRNHLNRRASVFENAVKEAPDSADRHANLGWFYAFMGRKDEAIREGRRAVELKPESKDAVDGAIMNCYLALIYARVGEKRSRHSVASSDLLKTPGAVDSVDYSITVNDLRKRWEWDPIRNDPRFKKLISARLVRRPTDLATSLGHTIARAG